MRISTVVLLSVLTLSCAFLATTQPGCINPPTNTVYIQDDSGKTTGLAYDRNKDGVPDMRLVTTQVADPLTGKTVTKPVIDADGKPVMEVDSVPGSSLYKTTEAVDSVAPTVLTAAGALFPAGIGAVLVGLGAAWRLSRFGRIFSNTVMSIQSARQRLKDNGYAEALKLLDEAVESGQLKATVDEIAKIKEKLGLPSVSQSSTK